MSQTRIKDDGNADGEALVLLDISIEAISLRRHSNGSGSDANASEADDFKHVYVGAVVEFCRLVLNNYDLVLTNIRKYLQESFSCKIRRVLDDASAGGSILFEMSVPRAKLVSLQCGQSGGSLKEELQKRLVTKNIRDALEVDELTITSDIRSAS